MSDFYQSQADKLRFEILLKSLREGRLNLAILGDDEAALTHYGKRIFQHLRQQGEPHVELWTSADSDRLVDRFNEILSTLTVDQALDKSNQTAPKRYMIFPDTHGIQDFELQLLARLVNGFPASNINVILLVNSRSAYDKKLSAFGKNLLQWVLESEAPAPAKPARVETLGDWPGAKQVISDKKAPASVPDMAAVSLPPVPPAPLDLSEGNTSANHLPDGIKDPEMGQPVEFAGLPSGEELAKSWEANAASSKRSGAWAWVSLFVLLASLAAFAVINQDRVLQEWENMRAYLSGAKPAAETTEDTQPSAAPVPPPPSVSMSSSTTPVVKPVEALNPDKEELVAPASPDPAPAATTPAPAETPPTPAASAPAVTEPPKAEPPKAELAAPAVVVPAKKSDKAKEADNPNWVAQLDPNAWVMQHGAFDSLSEARQFQSTSLGFKSGQVLFTQRKGSKPYYILLTGPYADKAQAQALMKDNPLLAKAWLRSAKSLQLQFQD
ncbi:MAG: SPOR domain-containing protein [Limnohabitans sp.]